MTYLKLTIITTFILSIINIISADELTDKYKKIINGGNSKILEANNQDMDGLSVVVNEIHNIKNEVSKVKLLKKGTFESSSDFKKRKEHAILVLENKIDTLLAKEKKEGYQAGTITMTSYNADTEVLTANVAWKNNLNSVLSNIDAIKKVTINIPRDDAKDTFSKESTHPIFITVKWRNDNLRLNRILITGSKGKIYYAFYNNMRIYTQNSSPSNRKIIITCEASNERYMILKHTNEYCNGKPYDAYSIRHGQERAECKYKSFKDAALDVCLK